MPYPAEHSARLASPAKFKSFRRGKLPGVKGIDAVYGIRTEGGRNVSEIQALRFDKDKWTVATARAWLKDHPRFKVMMFEPARREGTDES